MMWIVLLVLDLHPVDGPKGGHLQVIGRVRESLRLNLAASASNSSPFVNFTPWRSLNSQVVD